MPRKALAHLNVEDGYRRCNACREPFPETIAYFGRVATHRADGTVVTRSDGWNRACKVCRGKVCKRYQVRHPRKVGAAGRRVFQEVMADPVTHERYLFLHAQADHGRTARRMMGRAHDVLTVTLTYRETTLPALRCSGGCLYLSERTRYRATPHRYGPFQERDWTMMLLVHLLRRHTYFTLTEIAALLGEDHLVNLEETIKTAKRMTRNTARLSFVLQCRDLSNMLAARWGTPVRGKRVDLPKTVARKAA